eukprot:367888-Rhodomonas_salina.4
MALSQITFLFSAHELRCAVLTERIVPMVRRCAMQCAVLSERMVLCATTGGGKPKDTCACIVWRKMGPGTLLRPSYAMPGTVLARTRRYPVLPMRIICDVRSAAGLGESSAMSLRASYAMTGTDIAYAPTSEAIAVLVVGVLVLFAGTELRYQPTRVLRAVRY